MKICGRADAEAQGQSRVRWSVVAVASIIFAVAACSSGQGAEQAQVERQSEPVFVAQSEIEELLGVPIHPAEAAAWEDTIAQVAIVNCMADQGFAYVPVDVPSFDAVGGTVIEPELVTLSAAQDMLESERADRDALLSDRAVPTFGDGSADDQLAFMTALWVTCQAADPGAGGSTGQDRTLIEQFRGEVDAAYQLDGKVQMGREHWVTCMIEAGHPYSTPSEAQAHFEQRVFDAMPDSDDPGWNERTPLDLVDGSISNLEKVASAEAEVRAAHNACAVDWLAARAAVRDAVAADFIERHG